MTTSRPNSYDDLYNHERQNVALATIDKDLLETENLDIVTPLFQLLKAARDAGYIVENDGEYRIERERTTEELDNALTYQQRIWDRGKELHEEGLQENFHELANGKKKSLRFYVDHYLRKEGLDPIDWAAHENQAEHIEQENHEPKNL